MKKKKKKASSRFFQSEERARANRAKAERDRRESKKKGSERERERETTRFRVLSPPPPSSFAQTRETKKDDDITTTLKQRGKTVVNRGRVLVPLMVLLKAILLLDVCVRLFPQKKQTPKKQIFLFRVFIFFMLKPQTLQMFELFSLLFLFVGKTTTKKFARSVFITSAI